MFKKMKLAVALKRVSMDLKVMGVGMAPIPWHHMLTTCYKTLRCTLYFAETIDEKKDDCQSYYVKKGSYIP